MPLMLVLNTEVHSQVFCFVLHTFFIGNKCQACLPWNFLPLQSIYHAHGITTVLSEMF